MVPGVMWWLKQQSKEQRSCNYITSHNGFTLADLVSYDGKHNEATAKIIRTVRITITAGTVVQKERLAEKLFWNFGRNR